MADWRDKAVVTLMELGMGKGIVPFDQEKVLDYMNELADLERGKPEHLRVGFAYIIDTYEAKGLAQFFNRVKAIWPTEPYRTPDPIQKKLPGQAYDHECVVSCKLDSPNYQEITLEETFRDYFLELFGINVNIVDVKRVHDTWFDFKIHYSKQLARVYEAFIEPTWVSDAVTKPSSDFGKRTAVTFAR